MDRRGCARNRQQVNLTSNELPAELGFDPGPNDVRVERVPWVYWVRGVRSGEPFRERGGSGNFLADLLAAVVLVGVREMRWRRRHRWKVGVLRFRGSRWGPASRVAIVHYEVLPRGIEPTARIAELARLVESGAFDDDT